MKRLILGLIFSRRSWWVHHFREKWRLWSCCWNITRRNRTRIREPISNTHTREGR